MTTCVDFIVASRRLRKTTDERSVPRVERWWCIKGGLERAKRWCQWLERDKQVVSMVRER